MEITSEYFDQVIERRGSCAIKWDRPMADDVIPMWVADMDFRVAPPIIEALQRRACHGIYGYVSVPDAYYQATIDWFARRHGWLIERDWIQYTIGVVPALSVIIKAFTRPGDKVLLMTPVYNCFFSSIRNNGCQMQESRLTYEDATYHIDFDDLERKAQPHDVKLLLLCNPHNPAGRVWTRDELVRIGDICRRNGVIVVSDEIHCELVYGDNKYTPFASIDGHSDNCITCVSPSKSFNIAGLQNANIICSNPQWRERIDQAININEVCDVNPFGVDAFIAAYTQGEPWLNALCEYIYDNYRLLATTFARELPQLTVTRLEGTYLAWIDCRHLPFTSDQLTQLLLDKAHVMVNSGTMYGEAGEGFIRINLACQHTLVDEALHRLVPVLRQVLG